MASNRLLMVLLVPIAHLAEYSLSLNVFKCHLKTYFNNLLCKRLTALPFCYYAAFPRMSHKALNPVHLSVSLSIPCYDYLEIKRPNKFQILWRHDPGLD